MMEVIVETCRVSALTVSAKETDTHLHASTVYNGNNDASRSGPVNLQTGAALHLPGGMVVTETPDLSPDIARWTRAFWMGIRWYLRELYDQPKVALFLKTRMVKAEAVDTLLYG